MDGKLLILGVGNLLRSDDGVGVHAVRALARHPIAGVEVVDAGTDFLSALPFMEAARSELTDGAPMFREFTAANPLFPGILEGCLARLKDSGADNLEALAAEARAWFE